MILQNKVAPFYRFRFTHSGKISLSQELLIMSEQAGERIKIFINPEMLAAELDEVGFRLEENLNPSEINELYFSNRPDNY